MSTFPILVVFVAVTISFALTATEIGRLRDRLDRAERTIRDLHHEIVDHLVSDHAPPGYHPTQRPVDQIVTIAHKEPRR